MTLDDIDKRDTLETHYKRTEDINEAVKYCLEIKKKAEEK